MCVQQTAHIVDDDSNVIVTLTALLGTEKIPAVGFSSGRSFLSNYMPSAPGCLLLDIHMPDMSGLELQTRLIEAGVYLPIIMMTGEAELTPAIGAMKLGAIDVIQKPFSPEALIRTVRRAFALDVQLNAQRINALMLSERLGALTERERTVIELAASGNSSKEIARQLNISPRTVDAHRANILKKLEVNSIAELMRAVSRRTNCNAKRKAFRLADPKGGV